MNNAASTTPEQPQAPAAGPVVRPCPDGCGRWRADTGTGLFGRFDTREAALAWVAPSMSEADRVQAQAALDEAALSAPASQDPGTDALRARIAEALRNAGLFRQDAEETADALLPLFLDHGRQQAAQELRDAAAFCRTREDSARERRGDYNDGLANAYDAVADELETRADDIHGRRAVSAPLCVVERKRRPYEDDQPEVWHLALKEGYVEGDWRPIACGGGIVLPGPAMKREPTCAACVEAAP